MDTTIAGAPPVARPAAPATRTQQARRNPAVKRLRAYMLALVSAVVSFGVLAGLFAFFAVTTTYDSYHTLVSEGSVSVDAALQARALALDHMSAEANYLESTGAARQNAANEADQSWSAYNSQIRVSWSNLSDDLHGEGNVFVAADSAASDYIQQIGAMRSYAEAGQTDQAGTQFLAARDTLNTRLAPALGGLEADKVELMEATYAGADGSILDWRNAVIVALVLLAFALLLMLFAVRRMHYRWSWPVGLALLVTILLGLGLQSHLASAASDAEVLVRKSYDNVAGVQDMAALLSQQKALDSIIVFDPAGLSSHLADYAQYNTLIEQRLCGPVNCTAQTFLDSPSAISQKVVDAATAEQGKLGLARPPLVAAVYFAGQAQSYEDFRVAYRAWLASHDQLVAAVQANQMDQARSISQGAGAQAFTDLTARANAATQVARNEFNSIWQRIYTQTPIWQILALFFPLAGIWAAFGLWRRREELSI